MFLKCLPQGLILNLYTIETCGKIQMTVLPQSPYTLDLAPCDFFLLLQLKLVLNGRRFRIIEDKTNSAMALQGLWIREKSTLNGTKTNKLSYKIKKIINLVLGWTGQYIVNHK